MDKKRKAAKGADSDEPNSKRAREKKHQPKPRSRRAPENETSDEESEDNGIKSFSNTASEERDSDVEFVDEGSSRPAPPIPAPTTKVIKEKYYFLKDFHLNPSVHFKVLLWWKQNYIFHLHIFFWENFQSHKTQNLRMF